MDINKFHSLDIILLCGVYGAGKTDFAVKNFKGKGRMRVSRSEIRKLMYEMTHYGQPLSLNYFSEIDDSLVKHIERKILEQFLHKKNKVLIINTFVTKKSRKRFIEIAQSSKKSIGAIFISRSLEQCISVNAQSKIVVPENVIRTLHSKVEFPAKDEGFNEIAVLSYKE